MDLLFNIKDNDMKAKCNKIPDEKTRLENLSKSLNDFSKASKKTSKPGDYTLQKNIIRAALPCATEAQINERVNFYARK